MDWERTRVKGKRTLNENMVDSGQKRSRDVTDTDRIQENMVDRTQKRSRRTGSAAGAATVTNSEKSSTGGV